MVALPLAPERVVTTTAPQSTVSRGDVAAPYDQMASALSKVADAQMDIATREAKDQAADDLQQQKVVRNADGSVTTLNPANSLIFGQAGDAYHNAVQAGTIADHSNVISQEMTDLHTKYPTDPAAFKSASDAWIESYRAQHGAGITGQAIDQQAQEVQTQNLNAITNRAAGIDIDNQKKSIQATIEDQKNTLLGLSRQPGGTNTPQFQQSLQRMTASYQALTTNPLFKMPQDQVNLEVKGFTSLLQGEGVVAHIDDTFTKRGKAEAQKELDATVLQNPDLREVDRTRLYTQGLSRLGYLTADAKEKIEAGKQDVTDLKSALAKGSKGGGIDAENPVVGYAIQSARDRGDAAGAAQMQAAATVQLQMRGVLSLPNMVQGQVLGVDRTGVVNQSVPPEGRALLDRIAGTESGGRYNTLYGGQTFGSFADHPRVAQPITSGPDVGKTSSAAGRYQFLGSTWDQQAKKLGLKDFSPANQDAAAWDLAQTEYKAKTGKDLLPALQSGQMADVLPALSGQWSSLPGGRQPAGGAPAFHSNLAEADASLHLNPQERALYQRHLSNLTGPGGVDNPDGSRSTLFQTTVEHEGKFFVIPTVFDGKILWNKGATDPAAAAVEKVKQIGWDKFPSYKSEDEAEARYQQMHTFLEKDTESFQASKSAPKAIAPAANGGPGFTYADLKLNPYLSSAYVRTVAADPEGRVTAAKTAWASTQANLKNGLLPAPETVAEITQAVNMYPEKMAGIGEQLQGYLSSTVLNQMPEAQRQQVMEAYKTAAQGQDQHHINIANATLDQIEQGKKNLADHPYTEAVNRGWTAKPAAPIDPAQPDAIAPALQQRAVLSTRIGSMSEGAPPPLLEKEEQSHLQTALQGPQGASVLGQVSQALRPEDMQRLIDEGGFKDAVTGMSRSGDPAKMNAAYSFMDSQQRQNPLQFDRQFPDGLKDLRAWQSNLAFMPPDDAAKRLMRRYDPAQSAALDASEKVADTALKNVSADKVVAKFSTGFGPIGVGARAPVSTEANVASGALKADYDQNYKDGFAATGDPTAADKFAMEKLNLKYAVSPTNGNRVMANAPERYYPEVGGSHDWMSDQLDADIKTATGGGPREAFTGMRTSPKQGPRYQAVTTESLTGMRQYAAARALVPDSVTEQDIANKKPPSYQIVLMDAKTGRWGALQDAAGQPRRIRFDPSQPFAHHADEAEGARQAMQSGEDAMAF